MKKCNVCGAENEDVFTSCLICGAQLTDVQDNSSDNADAVPEVTNQNSSGSSGLSLKLKNDTESKEQSTENSNLTGNTYGTGANNMYGQNAQYGNASGTQYGYGQNVQSGNVLNTQYDFGQNPQYGNTSNVQYGYGQNPQYGNISQGVQQSRTPQPIKANKGKILAIWGGMVAVTLIALLLIFGLGGNRTSKKGVNSPEQVAEEFIKSMDLVDMTKMKNLCPPFMSYDTDEIKEYLDELAVYDTRFKFIDTSDKYEYTSSDLEELEEEIEYYYNAKVKLEAACDMNVKYRISMSYLGESYSEEDEEILTAIKYQGKWFMYE